MSEEFRTVGGKRVINLRYVPTNAAGRFCTFPIKATIVRCEKPLRVGYQIYTLDGLAYVHKRSKDDLVI